MKEISFKWIWEIHENISKFNYLYKNELSKFVKKTYREELFDLKTYIWDQNVSNVLYISVNITSLIVKAFADFAFWNWVNIKINKWEEEIKKVLEDNYFEEILYWAFINQSKNWYTVLRTRKDSNKDWERVIIEEIPYQNFYFDTNYPIWKKPRWYLIASKYINENEEERWVMDYYELQEDWKWKYTGWEWTVNETGATIEKINIEETLDFLPIVVIHNQKISDDIIWRSDIEEVLDLLEELNDRITQLSVTFIKHLNTKIALPESMLTYLEQKIEEWVITWWNELDMLWYQKDESKPEYIENKNYLIKDSMEYIDKILRLISAIVQVPTSFLWINEWWWAEKVEALKIKMMRFLKKVERKQRMMKKWLIQLIKNVWRYLNYQDIEVDIQFTEALPKDFETTAETYINLYNNWLVSKETAIKEIFNLEDEFAKAEIERIKQDNLLENITKQTL